MKKLFHEIQKIPLWMVLTGYSAFLIIIFATYHFDKNFLFPVLIITAVCVFLIFLKLETIITADFIYYRFFPYHKSFRKIHWNEIKSVKVRKYNAIREFGGWGINYGIRKKAFMLSGKMGIEIEMLNNKLILIGTKRPVEVEKILTQLLGK
ncbi:MAG TPA: hypothetical protein PK990_08140 [Salinivirgaceae bacterium]|nr:hypothetical protein [Salinivirgaceae bacterium]